MTGFALIAATGYSTSPQVTGKCYAADYVGTTPSMLTTAILDMETAYKAAAASTSTNLNLKGGLITGETLTTGVYEWGSDVYFTAAGITISGSPTDVFIFKTSGNVIAGSAAQVVLSGGALAANIFWQVAGYVDAGTTSHLEGVFLVKTHAAFKTGSSLNGRILAQTAVTLQMTTITTPTLLGSTKSPIPDFAEQLESSPDEAGVPTHARAGPWAATLVGGVIIIAGVLSCFLVACLAVYVLVKRSKQGFSLRSGSPKSRDTRNRSASSLSFNRSISVDLLLTPRGAIVAPQSALASREPPPQPEGIVLSANDYASEGEPTGQPAVLMSATV